MSVSVSMPQLGESVTEGTVTRWLKREGEHVDADEPLLEVSTDKVDTEIPSPVSGTLRGITVAEDETVAVGAELAVIDEDGAEGATGDGQAAAGASQGAEGGAAAASAPEAGDGHAAAGRDASAGADSSAAGAGPSEAGPADAGAEAPAPPQATPGYQPARPTPGYPPPAYTGQPSPQGAGPGAHPQPGYSGPGQPPASYAPPQRQPEQGPGQRGQDPYARPEPAQPAAPQQGADGDGAARQQATAPDQAAGRGDGAGGREPSGPQGGQPEPADHDADGGEASGIAAAVTEGAEGPYVTPLVRKLAAEHGVDLAAVSGTGVGGRIRKQDVLDAASQQGGAGAAGRPGAAAGQAAPAAPAVPAGQAAPAAPAGQAAPGAPSAAPAAPQPPPGPAPAAPVSAQAGRADEARPQQARQPVAASGLRGTTVHLSRARQVIAQRMVESLQTSAQLTTVIEADVTAIARLRDRYKAAFEAREGVKLSFLPFFALAAIEALKVHPELNAVIDAQAGTVTYHDAEHLGIAVDTDRGLMVPVIRNAGDLNIGGLARKIADLARRTRAGQVSPDDLTGGTFTLTNTGSRGALFDTPILNQPQVGILGTGTVDRRAVVVQEPALGEVITVRSIVHLALTYDHRLVDGADAARYLVTVKNRLQEGSFEAELAR